MTAAEEQEGDGLVGRFRRMSASEYGEHQMTRTLRDVVSPKVRGAALWAAHAFMATSHSPASDRPSGTSTQEGGEGEECDKNDDDGRRSAARGAEEVG